SPDGARIASASADRTVRVWDAVTGQQLGQPLTGHANWVYGVAFSLDGARIASTSDDRTVRIWEAATGQQLGQPLTGHTRAVRGVAFSPDGTRIASASQDHTIRLWPLRLDAWVALACERVGRNLSQAEWDEFVGADTPYVRNCPEFPAGDGVPADAPAADYHLTGTELGL
ncbi:MAG: WD40 repeat domain-containing protein, partial [Egibacteraceae bacterium]